MKDADRPIELTTLVVVSRRRQARYLRKTGEYSRCNGMQRHRRASLSLSLFRGREREQDSGWTRLNSKFNHGALNNELRHGTGSPTCWTDSPIFILIKRCVERCFFFLSQNKRRLPLSAMESRDTDRARVR